MSGKAHPVALLSGDDDLATARAVDGIAAAHAAGSGILLDRWRSVATPRRGRDLLGRRPAAFDAGHVRWWNDGCRQQRRALLRRNDHREALFGAIVTLAPGNVICFMEATPSGAKVAPRSVADAITAAGAMVARPLTKGDG